MEIDELLEEDFDEASDEADNDYQYLNDPSSTQPSSGPPSTPNSCASSPPINNEEPISPQRNFYTSILTHGGSTLVFSSGKPYGPKRGPGRPRKEFASCVRNTKDIRGFVKKCRGGIIKGTKKKFLGKDERNALLTISQENGFLQGPSKSPSDFTGSATEVPGSELIEKTVQTPEEAPYFLERWPGKVCALCNLGERSQLGQGEMLRLEINETEGQHYCSASPNNQEKGSYSADILNSCSAFPQFSNRRQKGLNKCKNPVNTSEYVDELEKVGYPEPIELSNIHDSSYYYVHRQCATWSFGILADPTEALDKITSVISQSLRRKCAFCNHYGASIACKMSCPKVFHFPCVSASGGFQIIQNYASFCKEHLIQVPLVCSDDVNCRSCSSLGDVSNLVMCSICGDHYHGTCIGLAQLPGVRAGWQCLSCRKCQICRIPDISEGRSLPCEQCHKVYHAHCLRPIMSSIPKYGWKCRRCRVCSDCGSRTPGAGASSRWHAHYTVCDSCYQQRNKGFSCPICHRAYRAAAYREMVKCSCCNKFVHSTCDPDADLSNYHAKKESNPDYDYICPPCKTRIQSGRHNQSLIRRNSHIDDDNMSASQESVYADDGDSEIFDRNLDFGLGKGKPFSASKIAKKRMGFSFGAAGRTKGKLNFQKRPRLAEFGRKRGPKTKMRGIFGVPGLGLQRPTVECFSTKNEDEPGVENRLVLCSAKDKFILTQDICVMCGAIGTDHEGCLIACTQCGQCYHPYCVNVKVTKVILKKGWRCLDCTVCEGCGQKNDEGRLILCDECDISYHIYCMDPPLDIVPQGNWKCKWCAVCHKCGKNSAGKNCSWKNSYSECGPCASQVACAFCTENYVEGELVIQCINCERWLHCKCDSIKNEEEAEKCDEAGYVCILCRPKDVLPPHLMPSKKIQTVPNRVITSNVTKSPEENGEITVLQGLDGTHFVDGVCLSEHGLNLIKSLQMEYIRKKRKQKLSQDLCVNNKDAGILAAIESVVAGSGIENTIEDVKVEPLDPKEEAEIYKDGMVWDRSDASPPEGFALCTNEQGVVVLRKKRQRNLQKLGIGGFNVRNRTMKKDGVYKDDVEENIDNGVSYISDNVSSEKKRKPIRKRHKSKLTETYPIYLQEAFFGKNLLDTNKASFESDSSDDDTKSNVSEDKIIKLSPEELKMLDCMKTELKSVKPTHMDEILADAKKTKCKVEIETSNLDGDAENNDQDPLKDIIPHDLLDSELVNSIINDGDELTKTSGTIEVVHEDRAMTPRKDDLADILSCSNFNLDSIEINSKDVEEIFQDVIDTDTKQTPIMNKRDTTMSPKPSGYSNNASDIEFTTDTNLSDVKPPSVVNNFLPIAQTFSNNTIKSIETPHTSQSNVTQSYMRPNDQNSNSPIPFGPCQVGNNWTTTNVPTNTRPSVESSSNQNDDILGATPTTQGSCNQKSSERMRRDEDLGEMATISAVLYANTNHPELKQDYPNWTDRCKQIYKRWRALSSEKKAPFLQQARDNRSALRMKKVQQDQEKITTQQKSLKQQEQERQWKQLQAMRAKEHQLQQFASQVPRDDSNPSSCNNIINFPTDPIGNLEKRTPYPSIPGTPRPQFNSEIVQPTVYAGQIDSYSNTVLPVTPGFGEKPTPKQQENKQLRDLLQRQEDVAVTTTQNRPHSVSPAQVDNGMPRWTQEEQTLSNQNVGYSSSTFREPFPVSATNRTIKAVSNIGGIRLATTSVAPNVMRTTLPMKKVNFDLGKRLKRPKDQTTSEVIVKRDSAEKETSNKIKIKEENTKTSCSEGGEIPDNVTAELEKLEQEENVVIGEVEGVGDILGGLGEDDDDELLNSLTAEMGADFNILEYADPELDALTDNDNHNLLDRLDFDEGDPDERIKKAAGEIKNIPQRNDNHHQMDKQVIHSKSIGNPIDVDRGLHTKNRNEFILRKDLHTENPRQSFIPTPQNFAMHRATVDISAAKTQDTSFRTGNLPRYNNIMPPGAACKIPRTNLPPPPPPYPGPPPPYPVNSNIRHNQEQPLLLEDLLEQEKREQQQMSSSIITNQIIEKKPIAQMNTPYIKSDIRGSSMVASNWRKKSGEIVHHNITTNEDIKKNEVVHPPLFTANLQPPPPQPPDNIVTEQDRILQLNYEQWLNNQNLILNNQLKYYEDEVIKLRKIRKSLNSKQRSMKKAGSELSPQDALEFAKVSSEQALIQKHLESSRKHCRQHSMLFQEYRSKHMTKVQMASSNVPSPAQITSMSPMLSPSTNSQSSLLMQTSPSPLGGHMLQCTKSPLHSPSPLLSHSPSGISQSPVHQSNSNASPYNTMQSSPRISTPHSQIDENSFSPSATIPSPSSLPGRHASPAPRITSPQSRMNTTQISAARIATSPGNSYASSLSSQQQSKFNSQERVRIQMTSQQHMHQSISPLGSPQPIVSPTQIHSFGNSPELLQSQRTMHFIQQRQIIQRQQQANQNAMKSKTQTASSPIQNHGMGSSPSSPLLQYNPTQNPSILINTLSNRRMNTENNSGETFALNMSPERLICHNREIVHPSDQQQMHYARNSQDGSGGGLSSLTGSYLPVTGSYGKYGRIKLGLFGGSPMWNISNVIHKINIEAKSRVPDVNTSENTKQSNSSGSEAPDDKEFQDKSAPPEVLLNNELTDLGGNSKNTILPKNSVSNENIAKIEGSTKCVGIDEVVVIDSSPDEKQGIIDYDDYQDKGFVATEVSLNSAAQNIADGDDITVIESFVSSDLADIVTSPLESEVQEEYVLFSTDVVDYVDSDDSLKQNTMSQKTDEVQIKCNNNFEKDYENSRKLENCVKADGDTLNNENVDNTAVETNCATVVPISSSKALPVTRIKSPEIKNFATAEDFEAMIDGRNAKEPVKIFEEIPNTTIAKPIISTSSNFITSNLLACSRTPFTSVQCNVINANSTTSTAVMVTPKKIVGDVSQTTAKVSIGNTTISVPLLKSMTLNSAHIMSSEKQNKVTTNVNLSKQPTILNVRGQKINAGKIVSLSSLQLKPTVNAGNAKIVQATVVGNKIQLPQTTVESLSNIKHNLMHTFSYPKLSSLTVLQDMALPNKIFEDESISPDSSLEQEDNESLEIKDSNCTKKDNSNILSNEYKNKDNLNDSKQLNTPSEEPERSSLSENIKDDLTSKFELNSEVQKVPTRVISIMPQLSPLSQPTEMTTNMANVSQQLRTIMSSINSSSLQVDKKSQDENTMNQGQNLSQYSSEKQNEAEEKEVKSSMSEVEAVHKVSSTNVTAMKVFLTTATSGTQFTDKVKISGTEDKQTIKKTKLMVPSSIFPTMPANLEMTNVSHVPTTQSSKNVLSSSCSQDNKTDNTVQLSSSNIKRSKSIDDTVERDLPAQIAGTKRYSLEVLPNKIESHGTEENISLSESLKSHDQIINGCKTSNVITQQPKPDESQNVLLKQLLQNSATTTSTVNTQVITARKVPVLRAPSLGVVSSLEAQLARPVIPPVPTSPPSLMQTNQQHIKLQTNPDIAKGDNHEDLTKKVSQTQLVTRETSFVSNPIVKNLKNTSEKPVVEKPSMLSTIQEQQKAELSFLKTETKILENNKVESERISPSIQITKKEANDTSLFTRLTSVNDETKAIKREFEESPPIKKSTSISSICNNNQEVFDNCDHLGMKDDKGKITENFESSTELKKKKKREYQKNRRQQMQMLSKEVVHSKKRPRKLSKFDEDYDNFIDNLMIQLRQMPSLQVLEPLLSRNYGICPPYGAGDLSKMGTVKDQIILPEILQGEYGSAKSKSCIDYYNTKPFGNLEMPPEIYPVSMHNGFYDQEFPPIKFESELEQNNKFDSIFKDRDIDTPESIVTSSSPECVIWDAVLPFPGLRVINEDCKDDFAFGRMSPIVPVIAPIPIKLQSGMDLSIDKKHYDHNKENTICAEWKNKSSQLLPTKDSNVTVTLTLTSSAAEDIMGVLRDLANILHIPPPTSYQIVERTTTPPSQKLGLYRTKGKDGKEGDPVDIQTILNGAAKFCRHCDVVILNTIIRAKACEFPLLSSNNELLNGSDDLYFCSKSCYKQFKWRPTNIIDDSLHSQANINSSITGISKFENKTANGQSIIKMERMDEDDDDDLYKNLSYTEDSTSTNNNTNKVSESDDYQKKSLLLNLKSEEFFPKSSRYKYFSHNLFSSPNKYKKPTEKEITEMLFRMNITVTPIIKVPEDTRRCIFCNQSGDGVADGPSRLLNFDVDKWVHLNCALWSDGVYETVNGALMNLEAALQASLNQTCTLCHQLGATIKCFKNRCGNIYHLSCAIKDNCIFYKNKTTHCLSHALKNEKENELTTLSVQRRVYVDRDESRQVAAVMHHSELSNLLRVGSLIFLNVGQLLPHQLQAFHNSNYIYPIGYKIIRFYWSMRKHNKRCRYICSIGDDAGRPEFRVLIKESSEEDIELKDSTPKAVWQRILEPLAVLRKNCELVQLFPKYVTGEDLFGLTEPAVVRILESLPGIETLTDYRFKYGRNPLLELPLAINPSGAARTEPKQKQTLGWRKPHTQRSGSTNQRLPLTPTTSIAGEVACPYSKQFVHSKSSQYKKMKQEWRNNVYLARSKIQGLGLYAARDLEKHTMVIEYIGEVIRTEVSELREKQYEARNRGIYMFRLDEDRVVDATLSGGLARYINHSCNPNCVTEIVEVDREYRIIIFAKRRINRGEELSYDYKFDIEDDAHKISCMCGAPNCRKWMN